MAKLNDILNNQLASIQPTNEEQIKIRKTAVVFSQDLKKRLLLNNISADVFIGGSLAKATLIKKEEYDVDIFVRFSLAYQDKDLSKLLGKFLSRKAKKIHGSRDYFQIKEGNITLEIVPVLRVNKPQEAVNVTDLSYFHVNYVLDKIKKNRIIADQIILAKAFCLANNCYGAEGYIRGFSGYSLELLICYYETFESFLKAIVKNKKGDKIIIDDSNHYKKNQVLKELNESKLISPIILIDPTFKQRNALAGLSLQTYEKFKTLAKEFLDNPKEDFFKKKDIFLEFRKKNNNEKINKIIIKTNKQIGDIAGTKSRKFYEFFVNELKKEFIVKDDEFEYKKEENTAYVYFILNKKGEEIVRGPSIKDNINYPRFVKSNKEVFVKKEVAYKKLIHDLTLVDYVKLFKNNYREIIKSMDISDLKLT